MISCFLQFTWKPEFHQPASTLPRRHSWNGYGWTPWSVPLTVGCDITTESEQCAVRFYLVCPFSSSRYIDTIGQTAFPQIFPQPQSFQGPDPQIRVNIKTSYPPFLAIHWFWLSTFFVTNKSVWSSYVLADSDTKWILHSLTPLKVSTMQLYTENT